MRVYIAGPMTGLPDDNHPAFNDMEQRLLAFGFAPINPARNFGGQKDLNRAEVMRFDLAMLLQCEAIVFLPGWQESSGASVEHAVAAQLGLEELRWGGHSEGLFSCGPMEHYRVDVAHCHAGVH